MTILFFGIAMRLFDIWNADARYPDKANPMLNSISVRCIQVGVLFLFLLTTGCSGCSPKEELLSSPSTPDSQETDAESQSSVKKASPETTSSEGGNTTESNDLTVASTASTEKHSSPTATESSLESNKTSELRSELSAKAAQKKASGSLQSAKRLAQQGQHAMAFQEILISWQELRKHSGNPSSEALAKELQVALEEYGEQVNGNAVKKGEASNSRKPLTIE